MAQDDVRAAEKNLADAQYAHRNDPENIEARLHASLAQGAATLGSFKKGGVVPKTGAYKLHAGETVTPAGQQPDLSGLSQPGAQPAADSQAPAPADQAEQETPGAAEEAITGESVNLKKSYSRLNSAICDLFDGLGIKRSLSSPHQDGQSMDQHITSVGEQLQKVGGATKNFISATHSIHHGGKGGMTVAHPVDKLHETVIPVNNEDAKKAVSAAKTFVRQSAFLLGDDPVIKTAKSQLELIGKHDMSGMSAFDAGASLLAMTGPIVQKIARLHSETKHGERVIHLTPPKVDQEQES
jgi:hypothetical protein